MPTGYELSFSQFERLLTVPSHQPTTADFLGQWYGYKLHTVAGETSVRSTAGTRIDPKALFDEIQSKPAQQLDLYQRAMNLWR